MTPITTNDALAQFCSAVRNAPFIAVDTEFMRETTYWPKLCLIQAALGLANTIVFCLLLFALGLVAVWLITKPNCGKSPRMVFIRVRLDRY